MKDHRFNAAMLMAWFLLLAFSGRCAWAMKLYVSPDGNDTWSGRLVLCKDCCIGTLGGHRRVLETLFVYSATKCCVSIGALCELHYRDADERRSTHGRLRLMSYTNNTSAHPRKR